MRKCGLGIRDPALVLGPTFIASNFWFAGSQGELPERLWRQPWDAWSIVRENLHLNLATLTAIDVAESIEPDDTDDAWTKQKRWQEQVDAQMEAHFKLTAPERLRACRHSTRRTAQPLLPFWSALKKVPLVSLRAHAPF